MLTALKRLSLASAGGVLGAVVGAAIESRWVLLAAPEEPRIGTLLAEIGLLTPIGCIVGLCAGIAHLAVEEGVPSSPAKHVARLRAEPLLARTRTAALAPLATFASLATTVFAANYARHALAAGTPAAAGAELALATGGFALLMGGGALALVSPLRRALAAGSARWAWLSDPVQTAGVAVVFSAAAIGWGVHAGDNGGDGAWPLGVFGVLARSELDLRPVALASIVVGAAYAATVSLVSTRGSRIAALVTTLVAATVASTSRTAHSLDARASAVRAVETGAPLGRLALSALRRATDRDHDGAARTFGGGDCDDHDPSRSPNAIDVPGNGVDEDCSGSDTPLPAPVVPVVKKPAERAAPDDLNVVLITVDTLRPDVGFMGYDKPTTPNLDALAAKGVVFERAYSLASYTGKSVGPLLIGKYPSETDRDGGHFNKYAPANTFVAERMKQAKIRTFGAASHWYFAAWSGLSQGMDEWDMSAKPKDGQGDNDTSVTSAQLSDAALRLLGKPANTSGRFFMWLHYFDPHEQYIEHAGAPDFTGGDRGFRAHIRASYDQEIWFTDKHIGRVLDAIAASPYAGRTAVIVTSDHGEAFGEHAMSWHGVEIWECLVRVPLLVYVPGVVPHRVPQKRSQIDLVPTLLDLMHVDAAAGDLSGVSLLPDVLGAAPFEERDVLVDMPVGPYTQMRRALLTGPGAGLKLIHSGGRNYQLYDLANDPDEARDLSGDPDALRPVVTSFERARAGLHVIDVKPDAP